MISGILAGAAVLIVMADSVLPHRDGGARKLKCYGLAILLLAFAELFRSFT